MIRIGTSGYNHRDWIGPFYSIGLGPARYLARYAEEFDLCELLPVMHRRPDPAEASRLLGESEGALLFTALAPPSVLSAVLSTNRSSRSGKPRQSLFPELGSGFLMADGTSDEVCGRDFTPPVAGARTASPDLLLDRLREGLLPYARAKRFGGVILRLPHSVHATGESLAGLVRCRDRLAPLPLLIEPRDVSWIEEEVLEGLRAAGIGFVVADGPDLEGPSYGPDRGAPRPLPARRSIPFAPVTAEIACVRFYGRNGHGIGAPGGFPDRTREGSVSGDAGTSRDAASIRAAPAHGARRRSAANRDDAGRRDYLYSWQELVEWLPALRALAGRARELYVVFDNPGRGRAIENARMLRRLVEPTSRGNRLDFAAAAVRSRFSARTRER